MTKPCSDITKRNRHSSEPSQHPGHGNSHGKCGHHQEGQGGQQENKQGWNYNYLTSTESTKIVNGCTFYWCSKCTPPLWSTTHLTAMHTDYSQSSACNTNAQLLDFNTAAWVVNVPVHDMKLAFSNDLHQAKAPTLSQPSKTSEMLIEPCLPPPMTLLLTPLNQPYSSPQQMLPSPGATCLQQPPQSSGTPLTLSPSPLMMKRTTLKP